ncbi:hypothetical protein E2C01_048494 [Portunus trituberculatus]|uniref:Uncharacterized protein n=1 Tax=Portunus trituberculatus TaxID=210409 RepID=A0A5B7GBA5_PORTR|nr:hypothetical protein [Portunus trituberculatus]
MHCNPKAHATLYNTTRTKITTLLFTIYLIFTPPQSTKATRRSQHSNESSIVHSTAYASLSTQYRHTVPGTTSPHLTAEGNTLSQEEQAPHICNTSFLGTALHGKAQQGIKQRSATQ